MPAWNENKASADVVMPITLRWLRDGEQDAIGIYRRPWTALITFGVLFAVSPVLLASNLKVRLWTALLILVIAVAGTLCWLRQAAIVTRTAILFRPVLGKTLEIPLAGIKRLSRFQRPDGEYGWIEVHRIEFLVGGFFDIPGWYIGKDNFVKRLEQLIQETRSRDLT